MSEIETTSKVSLKLTSRVNLGRSGKGAGPALDFGHRPHASLQSGMGYPHVEKGRQFP